MVRYKITVSYVVAYNTILKIMKIFPILFEQRDPDIQIAGRFWSYCIDRY